MNPIHLFLDRWMGALANASVQVALLIVAVAVATMLLRRSGPAMRYVLWGVVLLRLCLPFGFTSPLGVAGFSQWSHRPSLSNSEVPRHVERAAAESAAPGAAKGAASPVVSSGWLKLRRAIWDCCGIVWLTGTAILGVFVFRRWSLLRRIVDGSEPCHRPELIALLDELRGRLGIARAVGLRTLPPSADSLGPCAAGWRAPHILLPAKLAETWELAAIEPILIHELAHIRRGDVLVNAVQVLVQMIYWFHPLVWLANARLRSERELICDDLAVLHSGATSRRYGATILRAIEEIRPKSGWPFAVVGMGESGLSRRIRRLLDGGYVAPRPASRAAIGTVLFAGMLGVLIASEAPRKEIVAVSPPGGVTERLAQNTAGEKKAGDTAVVPTPDPSAMLTKEWKLPPNLMPPVPTAGDTDPLPFAVERGFTGDFGMARNWLIERGIVFHGKAAAFCTPSGYLIVRNTQAQLDLIDSLVDALLKTKGAPGAAADAPAVAAGPVIPKLELREVTVDEALKAITAATGIKVFYTPAGDNGNRLTLSVTNIPAMEAFRYVTELSNLKFSSEKDGVHVSAK